MRPAKTVRVVCISTNPEFIQKLAEMLDGKFVVVMNESDSKSFQQYLGNTCCSLSFEAITLDPANTPFVEYFFSEGKVN